MARFIGRAAELGMLSRAYRSTRSEFIPIYGRRRVGKSELVLRFMEDKPGVYYLGQQSSAALQAREFLREAARALGLPISIAPSLDAAPSAPPPTATRCLEPRRSSPTAPRAERVAC